MLAGCAGDPSPVPPATTQTSVDAIDALLQRGLVVPIDRIVADENNHQKAAVSRIDLSGGRLQVVLASENGFDELLQRGVRSIRVQPTDYLARIDGVTRVIASDQVATQLVRNRATLCGDIQVEAVGKALIPGADGIEREQKVGIGFAWQVPLPHAGTSPDDVIYSYSKDSVSWYCPIFPGMCLGYPCPLYISDTQAVYGTCFPTYLFACTCEAW